MDVREILQQVIDFMRVFQGGTGAQLMLTSAALELSARDDPKGYELAITNIQQCIDYYSQEPKESKD